MRGMWISGVVVLSSALAMACGGGELDPVVGDDAAIIVDGAVPDAGVEPTDGPPVAEPNWDAFFADDPPPQYCGPDDVDPPPLPGGTPDCPDDKNREGCQCDTPGATAACWPGMRVDRDRGICRDGTTTCIASGEFGGRWGPCQNYVLPVPGATLGANACNCFSAGSWRIDNMSPCFVDYGSTTGIRAVSTFVNGSGNAQCPTSIGSTPPPQPQPGQPWSLNRLTVDCKGQFRLCYKLRAGNVATPSANDCLLAESCVEAWYDTPGVAKELPVLPAWTSSDRACAEQFEGTGGYGEMTVLGLSEECEDINVNGAAYVFHRVGYCSSTCNTNPTAPGCENCSNGGSGSF